MTRDEIFDEMTSQWVNKPAVKSAYGLNEIVAPDGGHRFLDYFPPGTVEYSIFDVVATMVATVPVMFEQTKADIIAQMGTQKVGSVGWYVQKTLNFRYGMALDPATGEYPETSNYTTEEIEAMKIVKACTIEDAKNGTVMIIKAAKAGADGNLTPLTSAERAAVVSYLRQVAFAGVLFNVLSEPGDDIRVTMTIYYRPELMNASGDLTDGSHPNIVDDTVRQYLQNLPFNSEFSIQALQDALQVVPGVQFVDIQDVQTKRSTASSSDYHSVSVMEKPYGGYYSYNSAMSQITYRSYES